MQLEGFCVSKCDASFASRCSTPILPRMEHGTISRVTTVAGYSDKDNVLASPHYRRPPRLLTLAVADNCLSSSVPDGGPVRASPLRTADRCSVLPVAPS